MTDMIWSWFLHLEQKANTELYEQMDGFGEWEAYRIEDALAAPGTRKKAIYEATPASVGTVIETNLNDEEIME